MKSIFLFSVFVFLSFSCSESEETFVEDQGVFRGSYSYSFNGCETGKHSFEGESAEELQFYICEALVDDELNDFCAYSLREDRFYNDECDFILERDF